MIASAPRRMMPALARMRLRRDLMPGPALIVDGALFVILLVFKKPDTDGHLVADRAC
jgi:hypothetical protein